MRLGVQEKFKTGSRENGTLEEFILYSFTGKYLDTLT